MRGAHEMVTVKFHMSESMDCKSPGVWQFLARQRLREAGIPIGPWGTSYAERGKLTWHYDRVCDDALIVEWQDDAQSTPRT